MSLTGELLSGTDDTSDGLFGVEVSYLLTTLIRVANRGLRKLFVPECVMIPKCDLKLLCSRGCLALPGFSDDGTKQKTWSPCKRYLGNCGK
jgi:hypothetical protein